MTTKNTAVLLILALLVFAGCAPGKNYRNTDGVLKTDTRSAEGIHK
jgi:hypothetical protein